MDIDDLQLHTRNIGELPAINHFIGKLHLDDILKNRLPVENDPDTSQCISILIRNILVSREPMYGIGEWISGFPAELLGISGDDAMHINDDRIGKSLERIFDSDRSSLLTDVVVHAVREFDLSMKRFHNDSTSVALNGLYHTATGKDTRMKRAVNLTFGRSKDHRKDLKQLVWILTVTADGAVPVHYSVVDGNTNDSPTHIETWDSIRKLTGRPDFMYVADSKLCTDENMRYIDEKHGRFITVLPATRKDHDTFRAWLQDHPDPWEATVHGRKDEKGQVWKLMESPIRSSDGFRIIWAWSSQKSRHDRDIRNGMMNASILNLERLETKLR